MKALSIKQPWANLILTGEKTIEVRGRNCSYRGELLLCSSKSPALTRDAMDEMEEYIGRPYLFGQALCIARLVDSRPLAPGDEEAAFMDAIDPALHGWVLEDIRPVVPFTVKGALGFYEVDDAKINPAPFALSASVRIRDAVEDDDPDMPTAGWHGRIVNILFDEEAGWLFGFLPDSISIQQITAAHIESSVEEDEPWQIFWLFPQELEPAAPRDTYDETTRAVEQIESQHPALFPAEDTE